MARGRAVTIVLSDAERVELERRVRRRKSSHGAALSLHAATAKAGWPRGLSSGC